MKRPTGFTILSLVMAWLGLAGIGNFWIVLNSNDPFVPKFLAPFMLAYGIAAFATMIGLWKMRRWVLVALKAWMAICVLFMLTFGIFYNSVVLGGILGLIGFLVFVSVLFALLYGYVDKSLQKAA